jgi:hypothetical protein
MKAKTYKSTNGFTAPQSLSTFGIKITNGKAAKYLGLEEFNFCPIVKKYKFEGKNVAFVPCFSTMLRNPIEKLDLFFLNSPGVTLHYATLYNVSQIQTSNIASIRQDLIGLGLPDFVQNSAAFQNNYGVLFNPAIGVWNNYFNSNAILARGTKNRFILNTFYTKIEIHKAALNVNWSSLKFAGPLYT